jgi:hypothetical protein
MKPRNHKNRTGQIFMKKTGSYPTVIRATSHNQKTGETIQLGDFPCYKAVCEFFGYTAHFYIVEPQGCRAYTQGFCSINY